MELHLYSNYKFFNDYLGSWGTLPKTYSPHGTLALIGQSRGLLNLRFLVRVQGVPPVIISIQGISSKWLEQGSPKPKAIGSNPLCPAKFYFNFKQRRLEVSKNIIISPSEAVSLADFIQLNLIDVIRNDVDIDSIEWIYNLINVYKKCSGQISCTDE